MKDRWIQTPARYPRRPLAALIALGVATATLAGFPSVSTARETAREPHTETLLARGAGYAEPGGSDEVRALQRRLRTLSVPPGPIDGLYGPMTEDAVKRFQRAGGLAVDGIVGPETRAALRTARTPARLLAEGAGIGQPRGSAEVRVLQRQLREGGFAPGPIDGRFGPRTEAAVERLQRARGLAVDGIVGPHTRGKLASSNPARVRRDHAGRRRHNEPRRGRRGGPERPESHTVPRPHVSADRSVVDEVGIALAAAGGLLLAGLLIRAQRRSRRRAPREEIRPTKGAYATTVPQRWGRETRGHGSDQVRRTPPGRKTAGSVRPERAASSARRNAVPSTPRASVRAIGYVCVADVSQLESAELLGRASAIERACRDRGWRLVELVRDVERPRAKPLERPGLTHALMRIGKGDASHLVIPELGHLGRSVAEVGRVLKGMARNGVSLLAVEPGIDTSVESGRLAVEAIVSLSISERKRLAERTSRGLAAARAKGAVTRPAVADKPQLKRWIRTMRAAGMTLQGIADVLNDEGVPTLRGGEKWRPSSVQAAVGYRRPQRRTSAATGPPGKGMSA
jgi:peptidoglycan hydrolase-like protein with peptidoglycan-binding domain/DNA invertase Pin-like site-specific DNA recombinase